MSQTIDNSNAFDLFILLWKGSKNSVVKIQNLVLNYESRPVKSNPAVIYLSYSCLPFYAIYMWIKINVYVKKNYFVFIIHEVNKHGVSRRWFTEADVKNFKTGALRIITNLTRSLVNWKKKKISSQVYFKSFVHRYRAAF